MQSSLRLVCVASAISLGALGCGSGSSTSVEGVEACTSDSALLVDFADLSQAPGRPLPTRDDYEHALVVLPNDDSGLGSLDPAWVVTGSELIESYGLVELGEIENSVVLAFETETDLVSASCYLKMDHLTGWTLHSIRVVEWSS